MRVLPTFPCYIQGQRVNTEVRNGTASRDPVEKQQLAVVLQDEAGIVCHVLGGVT
jgi:hypothetical protein